MSNTKLTPILQSAIESLEHGIEHFFLKYGKSNKFSLIHIDQAAELLLKAKIQKMSGASIYTKKGKTIDFHECFERLNNIDIPERGFLEEIHDKRNSSQHIGASFDDYSMGFYVKFVYSFFKDFMKREFNEELDLYLSEPIKIYIDNIIIEPTKIKESQLEYINDLIKQGKYEQSVISSWNALEFLIKAYSDESVGKSIDDIINSIKSKVKFECSDIESLKNLKNLKDSIFFSHADIDLKVAQEIYDSTVDISNSKIVIVPIKTPEKISKRQISIDNNAEPVRIIDDTTPVENEQELFFTNLKLYNSDNKYVSDLDTILKLYKNRRELKIEEIEGYEFLVQSAIHHKIPCWFWATELTHDKIADLISRNLPIWRYNSIYHSIDVLVLLSNKKSNEILENLIKDSRVSIASKSSKLLRIKNNLVDVRDYFGINGLKRLEHIKKIKIFPDNFPKSLNEKIINEKTKEDSTVFKIIKMDNGFEILFEYFDNGNKITKKMILDALSYVKDEKSVSFYLKVINDVNNYLNYRDIILKLDAAIYCSTLN